MKIRVLLIGLGRIASLLEKDRLRYHPCTHAGVLLSPFGKKRFELVGIWDTKKERVDQFLSDWSLSRAKIQVNPVSYAATPSDLAVIASNTENHFENAIFAIESGVRNLLIEKPVTYTFKQAKELAKWQKRKKVNVWVNHERRFHPLYRFVREKLQAQTWGTLKTIKAAVLTNAFPEKLPKGEIISPLRHDGTHALDYIHWLLGMPDTIWSRSHKSRIDVPVSDQNYTVMEYRDGITVFLESGGMREYFQFELDIQTTQGRIVLSNDGSQLYLSQPSQLYENFNSLKKTPFPAHAFKGNPFISLYQEIDEFIRGKSQVITGGLSDNIEIMTMLENIEKKGKRV